MAACPAVGAVAQAVGGSAGAEVAYAAVEAAEPGESAGTEPPSVVVVAAAAVGEAVMGAA